MTLSLKTSAIVGLGLIALGWAVGRYGSGAKSVAQSIVAHRTTTDHSIIVHKPDGTVITHKDVTVTASKTTQTDNRRWSIKGLAAVQPARGGGLSYGLEVDYRIVGPIVVGAFGLTNGTVGVGIGIVF